MDKSKYLKRALTSYKMSHVQTDMDKYIEKREKVKDSLEEAFSNKKATRAINSGSNAKFTAINKKFDIDVAQPFLYGSYSTLEEMADAVFDFFYNDFEDDDFIRYETRRQRVSVGISFFIEGKKIDMDVVPGRELKQDDYKETNRLNLYVRAKGIEAATSTQTNIQRHVSHISGKGDERKIIRLLKIWKVNHGKKLKSFFIELITIRAFDDASEIPIDIWGKLKMVMEFIRDKVETIRLVDPANCNNIVSDTLDTFQKKELSDDMGRILDRIEDHDENIKIYFPVNDEFDEEETDQVPYTILTPKSFS